MQGFNGLCHAIRVGRIAAQGVAACLPGKFTESVGISGISGDLVAFAFESYGKSRANAAGDAAD
jgi:hypothetical protein